MLESVKTKFFGSIVKEGAFVGAAPFVTLITADQRQNPRDDRLLEAIDSRLLTPIANAVGRQLLF